LISFQKVVIYSWDLGPFSQCSASCGRGTRTRSVLCRAMPEGNNSADSDLVSLAQRLPDIMCPAPKPSEAEDCGQSPCSPRWKARLWNEV